MKKFSFLMSLLVAMVLLSSCTRRITDFTIISTRNVPIGQKSAVLEKAGSRVKGKDTAHSFLMLQFGLPNMKEAIDKALEKYYGAVALADGVVKSNWWSIFIYGQNSIIVEGTPIYEPEEDDKKADKDDAEGSVMFFYEVKEGDTVSSIAETYKVTLGQILKWNELSTPEVPAGTKLKLYVK